MSVWSFDRPLETDPKACEWGFSETHDFSFVEMWKVPDDSFHREMSKEADNAGGGPVSMEKAINLLPQQGCGSCELTPHPASMSSVWVIVIVMR